MDNSSDTVLTKQSCCSSQNHFAVSHVLAGLFDDCVMQNHMKNKMAASILFVGQMTARLQASICCEKDGKEVKTKDFNLAEEGTIPAGYYLIEALW